MLPKPKLVSESDPISAALLFPDGDLKKKEMNKLQNICTVYSFYDNLFDIQKKYFCACGQNLFSLYLISLNELSLDKTPLGLD